MASAVLDSSAVLALVNHEPGSNIVRPLLEGAVISIVNYAEVLSKLVENGAQLSDARAVLVAIDLEIAEFDVPLAERTAELRTQTRRFGLSLADRACLALAERERLPAVTGDRAWKELGLEIDVTLIR